MEPKAVSELFEEIEKEDPAYAQWSARMNALASFVTDCELLQGMNNYSLEEVAKKAGKFRSTISRLLNLKGKPTYETLQRVSEVVGGQLYVTPLGNYSVTLPYDLIEVADKVAEQKDMKVLELLFEIVRDYFDNVYRAEDDAEDFDRR